MFIFVCVIFVNFAYANGDADLLVRKMFEKSSIDNGPVDFPEYECKALEDFVRKLKYCLILITVCEGDKLLIFDSRIRLQMFENTCDGRSCWESQLRDTTRLKILQVYNDFRVKVAKGDYGCCPKNTTESNINELVIDD